MNVPEIIERLKFPILDDSRTNQKRKWSEIFKQVTENPSSVFNFLIILYDDSVDLDSKVFVRHGSSYTLLSFFDLIKMIDKDYKKCTNFKPIINDIVKALEYLNAGESDESSFFHSENPKELPGGTSDDLEIHNRMIDNIVNKLKYKNVPSDVVIAIDRYLRENYFLEDFTLRIKIYDKTNVKDFSVVLENSDVPGSEKYDNVQHTDLIYGHADIPTIDYSEPEVTVSPAKFDVNSNIAVLVSERVINYSSEVGSEIEWPDYTYTLHIYLGNDENNESDDFKPMSHFC